MDEHEKHATSIRQQHGKKGMDYISGNRRDAIMQRDADMIAYWEAVLKAYQRQAKR